MKKSVFKRVSQLEGRQIPKTTTTPPTMASEAPPAGAGAVRVDTAGGGYFASMEGVHEMVAWVKERIRVAGYKPSMWDSEKHGPIVSQFLFHPNTTRLLAYVAKSDMTSLVLQTDSSAASAVVVAVTSQLALRLDLCDQVRLLLGLRAFR